jgi:hypothetical protein
MTGLSIVPVKVRAKGNNNLVETYAFLDPGSNTTFCTNTLNNRLGISGTATTLSLTTMNSDNAKSESKLSIYQRFTRAQSFQYHPRIFRCKVTPIDGHT